MVSSFTVDLISFVYDDIQVTDAISITKITLNALWECHTFFEKIIVVDFPTIFSCIHLKEKLY